MPRKPRINYPGALYHVICRGNNREWIFKTDAEKQEYKTLISEYKKRYDFKVYGWVILSNHVHLIIEVGQVPLSKIMQGIQQNYTQWYNRVNKRTGHVFEQRYKAIHCNKDLYLLMLIRYIHQNPVRAKLEDGLQYPWSSHKDYSQLNDNGLTDIRFPLGLFAEDAGKAVAVYLDYMDDEEETIGTMKPGELEEGTQDHQPEISEKKMVRRPLNELIEAVASHHGITAEALTGRSRIRKLTAARKTLMLLAAEYSIITQREIAEALGLSTSAVSKQTNLAMRDNEIKERVEGIALSR